MEGEIYIVYLYYDCVEILCWYTHRNRQNETPTVPLLPVKYQAAVVNKEKTCTIIVQMKFHRKILYPVFFQLCVQFLWLKVTLR